MWNSEEGARFLRAQCKKRGKDLNYKRREKIYGTRTLRRQKGRSIVQVNRDTLKLWQPLFPQDWKEITDNYKLQMHT